MTGFIYPRLRQIDSEELLDEINATYKSQGLTGVVRQHVSSGHPHAEPVPTGGRLAPESQIESVRQAVVTKLESWLHKSTVPSAERGSFDLALGEALTSSLDIVPSDAAHDGTWSFLTLVVMPDVAILRFPDRHPTRMFGGHRNPLRYSWFRHRVLGDLNAHSRRPLGVDEMVNLFERSAMARNPSLIRAIAMSAIDYDGQHARSEWVRKLCKEVRYLTGPRCLDGMSEHDLWRVVDQIATRLDLGEN